MVVIRSAVRDLVTNSERDVMSLQMTKAMFLSQGAGQWHDCQQRKHRSCLQFV
jgi:hypothetical protein